MKISACGLMVLLITGAVTAQNYTANHEEIVFQSRNTTLVGMLHLPEKRGPHPAIVTVHGSGRVTRSDPFHREIADHFTKRGIAVFTFDKRGVGDSKGTYPGSWGSSMVIYAMDALAAIDHLSARADIDGGQMGLWGISQGGYIIPVAAAVGKTKVAFAMIVSGPVVSIGEENYYSELTGDDPGRATRMPQKEAEDLVDQYAPKGYDPSVFVPELTIPVLWLYGELDKSVPVKKSIANLEAMTKEWQRPFTWHVFPGANHGLRQARTGGHWERPRPSRTVPGYFEYMDNWLEKEAKVTIP